jgi:hypothetical protein
MYLLTTYTHDLELQSITAPPLISTIQKSPQHPLNLFATCRVFTSRSLATASNSVDSSASRVQVLCSQPPVQNCPWTDFIPCFYHLGTDHVETPLFQCCGRTVALLRICCLAMGLYATILSRVSD